LGRVIRSLRRRRGFKSERAFAKALVKSPTYVSELERGRTAISEMALAAIEELLGFPTELTLAVQESCGHCWHEVSRKLERQGSRAWRRLRMEKCCRCGRLRALAWFGHYTSPSGKHGRHMPFVEAEDETEMEVTTADENSAKQ